MRETAKPYRKLIADEHDELFEFLLKDPLLLAIFILCGVRARRILEPSFEGLGQGEFWLSETEWKKFGLKSTQKGQIRRKLQKLIGTKFIQKIEGRMGNQNASVYRLISTQIIDPNFETENKSENEQRTGREQIETNNNDKNGKNVQNAIIESQIEKDKKTESPSYKKECFDKIRKEALWLKPF